MTYEKGLDLLKTDLRRAIEKAESDDSHLLFMFKCFLENPKKMHSADFKFLAFYIHGVNY